MTTRTWRMLRWPILGLLTLGNTMCATIDRGASRASLSATAGHARAVESSYGCEGELLNRQVHRQLGGTVAARYEAQNGGIAQVDAGLLRGTLTGHAGFDPVASRSPYDIASGGLLVGWDWKGFGADLGAMAVAPLTPRERTSVIP